LPRALVAQRIEQKTFRLDASSPNRTSYKGSGGVNWGRALSVHPISTTRA